MDTITSVSVCQLKGNRTRWLVSVTLTSKRKPQYLKSFRNGTYRFTHDQAQALAYIVQTAMNHAVRLAMTADPPAPVAPCLSISYNEHKTKEDSPMTKTEFVTFEIQHHEDFPEVGEIDLNSAATFLSFLDKNNKSIPDIPPEEFMNLWNQLVHDPEVMDIY